jgi:hypothetical protein
VWEEADEGARPAAAAISLAEALALLPTLLSGVKILAAAILDEIMLMAAPIAQSTLYRPTLLPTVNFKSSGKSIPSFNIATMKAALKQYFDKSISSHFFWSFLNLFFTTSPHDSAHNFSPSRWKSLIVVVLPNLKNSAV